MKKEASSITITYKDVFTLQHKVELELRKIKGDKDTVMTERLKNFKRLFITKTIEEDYNERVNEIYRSNCVTDPKTGAILRVKNEFKDKDGNTTQVSHEGYQFTVEGEKIVHQEIKNLLAEKLELDTTKWSTELKSWVNEQLKEEEPVL